MPLLRFDGYASYIRRLFYCCYNNAPVVPVYNEDGSYYTGNDNAYNQGNMVKAQDENYKLSKNNYFYGQGDAQFEIIEGLNVKQFV